MLMTLKYHILNVSLEVSLFERTGKSLEEGGLGDLVLFLIRCSMSPA